MDLLLDGKDWQLAPLLPSEWVWRNVWTENWEPNKVFPVVGRWISGTVPGDVISDSLDAGLIPDPYVDLQSLSCEWLSLRDWVYRKRFSVPSEWQGKTVRLHFGGVDYVGHVYLNEQFLGKHEGMASPFEYDVSSLLRYDAPNTLVVIVEHAPPVEQVQGQIGWTSRARTWKPRFAYDWDWCVRLVPVGIWQSVRLIATDSARIDDVWVRPVVNDNQARADITITLKSNPNEAQGRRIRVGIVDPDGEKIFKETLTVNIADGKGQAVVSVDFPSPRLWYPNDMGDQPLYRAEVEVLDDKGDATSEKKNTFGLRSFRMVANDDSSPDALPYTIEINGRKVFVKGWNWAPIDNMYGRKQTERYERWLTLAKHAHANLLRVWGGGYLEREEFYDFCDRFGILVWQELMMSSSGIDNAPPTDEEFLQYAEEQTRAIVPQRRNHPSLIIWCGGNELFTDGVPLTSDYPTLARCKKVVEELDPDRFWLPTSSTGPVFSADPALAGTGKMHDVHGPWQYAGPVNHYDFYNRIDPLYHSEFGVEGATNLQSIKRFVSPSYQMPPDANNPVWMHHGAWWIHDAKVKQFFGESADIETFVKCSQWIQAEGLRYAIEANRRRKWHCSGTSPWQFNEAFPNTACTNAIDYLGQPKPVFWWARRAYEPTHISLKYDKLVWAPGEKWTPEVWLNNCSSAVESCSWRAILLDLDGNAIQQFQGVTDARDNASMKIADLEMVFPERSGVYMIDLSIQDAKGEILSQNEYFFTNTEPLMLPMFNAPKTTLQATRTGGVVEISNVGAAPALMIQLLPEAGQWIIPGEDYFCLLPGAKRQLALTGSGVVNIEGWNTNACRVSL